MPDILTPAQRHCCMSHIRSKATKPEILVRKWLWAHGHEGCKQFVLPKTNTPFWQAKIDRNRERDQRNYNDLMNAGWQVVVIWACNLTKDKLEATMHQTALTLNRHLLALLHKTQKK